MLDDHDRSILELVQRNNQLTHAAIAEAVCLSASAVRRRLRALRESGVIQSDVSIVDPDGRVIQIVVLVRFQREGVDRYRDFKERMLASPEVSQCYSVAGDVDFVLVVNAPDLAAYEAWGERVLMKDPDIRRYDSLVVYSRAKFTTELPADALV